MADEANSNGGAPVAPVVAPAVPTVERFSIPASAVFSEDELTLPAAKTDDAAAPVVEKTEETPAPAAKTDDAAAPVVEKTEETPAPAAKTDDAAAPAAKPEAKPAKFKVGGKEYTEAELQALVDERNRQAAAPAPAPAKTPEAPAPKPLTPEEVAQQESAWVSDFVKNEKVNFPLTNDEMETFLSGGEDAAKLFATKLNSVCATAVMLARKSVYREMNPLFAEIQSKLAPVYQNAQEVEVAAAEHQFVATYPDFKSQMDTVKNVTGALLRQYPAECAKMTQAQLMEEVARQTDRILQSDYMRFNPSAKDTWRDALKRGAAAPSAPAAAAPTPAPAAAAPAKPAAPRVPAPAANSPAAVPASGGGQNWHKETAKSLAD